MQNNAPQSSEEQPEEISSSPPAQESEETQPSQPPTREERPKWWRADLEATGTSTPPSSMQNRQSNTMARERGERGGWLTAWLVLVALVNILVLILALELFSAPGGAFGLLYLLISGTALVGVVGTWLLKKWGFYTLIASHLIAFLSDIVFLAIPGVGASGGSVVSVISTIIAGIVTFVLCTNRWEEFE